MGCVVQSSSSREDVYRIESSQPSTSFTVNRTMQQRIPKDGNWIHDDIAASNGAQVEYVDEEEMKQLPHRHIGVVLAIHQGGIFQVGTGILISRNLVLTCAHVIHCKKYGNKLFPSIYFYPGQYGKLQNLIEVEDQETPEQYTSDQKWLYKRVYDYSLLKLKENVRQSRFIPLSEDLFDLDKTATLSIYGYPESKYQKKNGWPDAVKQFGLTRRGYILDIYPEAGYMVHRISTEAGQSGAPVIKVNSDGTMNIVGIHLGSPEDPIQKYQYEFPQLKKVNIAKLTNKHMITRMIHFAQKLKGEMFLVTQGGQSKVDRKLWEIEIQLKSVKQRQLQKQKEELLLRIKKMETEKTKLKAEMLQQKKKGNQNQSQPLYTQNKLIQKGKDHVKTKRYEQALQCYRLVIQTNPQFDNVHLLMAHTFVQLNKYEEAAQSFQKALEIDPKNPNIYLALGNNFLKLQRFQSAVGSYKKGLAISPNFPTMLCNMGNALYKLERFQEAMINFKKVIEANPHNAYSYLMLGAILSQLEQYEEAIIALNTAIQLDPNYLNPQKYKAKILYQLDKFEQAVEGYKKILEVDPNDKQILINIFFSLTNLRKFDQALDYSLKAIKIDHSANQIYEMYKMFIKNNYITKPKTIELSTVLEEILAKHPQHEQVREIYEILNVQLMKSQK